MVRPGWTKELGGQEDAIPCTLAGQELEIRLFTQSLDMYQVPSMCQAVSRSRTQPRTDRLSLPYWGLEHSSREDDVRDPK